MSYTYANRKKPDTAEAQKESAPTQPSVDALRAGAASPTQEQMGRRVDLPDAMRAKMEESFGADLSAVKLYESQAVADAGANAITQGSNIAFAPGMLDFTSFGGQSLLGHEISHVVSQARGEVTGGGFLNDHALEARADREGAMAAAGQQIAMPMAAPMSGSSAVAAAGPMQADKKENKIAKHQQRQAEAYDKMMSVGAFDKDYDKYEADYNNAVKWEKFWAGKDYNKNGNALLSGNALLDRAAARNTDAEGKLDEAAYFTQAQRIMESMDYDRLMSEDEAGFRNRLVDESSARRKESLPSTPEERMRNSGNAFVDLGGDDHGGILGRLYTRMMGKENIRETLSGAHNNQNAARISKLADESGVTGLLARQHNATYGDNTTPEEEHRTMRDFWKYSVLAPMTGYLFNKPAAQSNAEDAMDSMVNTPKDVMQSDTSGAIDAALEDNVTDLMEYDTAADFQKKLSPMLAAMRGGRR